PQSCKGTETRRCDISVYVPGYGQCSVGFDYTVNFNGTSNYCTYTGNKDAYCNYHTCIRNLWCTLIIFKNKVLSTIYIGASKPIYIVENINIHMAKKKINFLFVVICIPLVNSCVNSCVLVSETGIS